MKVGDMVIRWPKPRFNPMGKGIILDSYENDDGVVYHEVQWFDDDRMWYDVLELKVVSESR
jgi:hypothetical protein